MKKKEEKEVQKYTLKNGEARYRYRYKYHDVNGKEAERALLQAKVDVANGNLKKVQYSQITVGQWLDIWYEMYSDSWAISTCVVRKQTIKKHMKPLLGRFKLEELDRSTYIRFRLTKL
ncbi:hypothetical protein BBD42_16865 [Paenibacillus sp. BIHB 4019]|uniref:Integrase SAM-like N-terminal domain-containing protein n=1 Tax=Paenibacillus sp. BIHB 4019 TaxID=1870819 RepID=A0A1B2DJT1_9BACL|nr:hypothetical protein [Paenibacillus sp. BIHB 4019]ANY67959.1 hypothetical protein BBD42_16865 [Paenibacillus sp. BIHB 4019]